MEFATRSFVGLGLTVIVAIVIVNRLPFRSGSGANEALRSFGGVAYDLYGSNSISIEESKGKLTITGMGGIRFRLENETESVKLLSIEGKNIQGRATLRVGNAERANRWIPAPDGNTLEIRLAPKQLTEVLIYQDDQFKYQLHSIGIRRCDSCMTRELFKQKLIAHSRGLLSEASDEKWEQLALYLLDFAANKVALGPSLNLWANANFYSAPHLTRLFDESKAAGACGLFAYYYSKLLELFGIVSLSVDFGIDVDRNLTHVTNVVRSPQGKYYIFDPTFNAVYRNRDGSIADLSEVLANRRDVRIESKSVLRDIWVSADSIGSFHGKSAIKRVKYRVDLCKETDLFEGKFWLCPNVPYDISYLLEEWSARLSSLSIYEETDLMRNFFEKGEVYSIVGKEQGYVDELVTLFKRLGVKVRD